MANVSSKKGMSQQPRIIAQKLSNG